MPFINFEDIEKKELIPGYFVRFVHTDHLTMAYWEIKSGAPMPVHAHPHEQVTTITEGAFSLILDGEEQVLTAGQIAVIPPETKHGGHAESDCRIVDVFYPVREDYR